MNLSHGLGTFQIPIGMKIIINKISIEYGT